VAVKILSGALTEGSAEEKRFRREGWALSMLHHPAIVPLIDAGRFGSRPFLVMSS
jgi:serine/threonine protein kinase